MFFDDVLQTPPDAIRPVAQMYFDRADAHDTQIRAQQSGAATLQTAWQGTAADTYQATHSTVTQKSQADVSAMRSTAHTLMIIMNLINIILTAITIFKILQAAAALLAVAGFFTAGATEGAAAAAEEGALAAQGAAVATDVTAKAILKAIFSALLSELRRRAIGAGIGAVAGLGIGVGTSIVEHRSVGDSILPVIGDVFAGAGGGFEMSGWTPWTTAGVGYGLTQSLVDDIANGNFDLEGNFDTVMGDSALFTGIKDAWNMPNQAQSLIDNMNQAALRYATVGDPLGAFDINNPDPGLQSSMNDATNARVGALKPTGGRARPAAALVVQIDGGDPITIVSTRGDRAQCAEGNLLRFVATGDTTGVLDGNLQLGQVNQIALTGTDGADLNVMIHQVNGLPPCQRCQGVLPLVSEITQRTTNVVWDNAAHQFVGWTIQVPLPGSQVAQAANSVVANAPQDISSLLSFMGL